MDPVSKLYEETIVLPAADFSAPGDINFFCWCTEPDGSGTRYGAGQILTVQEKVL